MNKKLRHIVRGVGSLVDISPNTNYKRFIPRQSATERMEAAWNRTGKHLENAINKFSDEQKQK